MNNVLDALFALEADAGVKERMARWIAESRSLGIDIPNLTDDHVRLFERLVGLEASIAEWHERREGMKSADDERLWRKLRLEWNYNSNHIEGNTLTYHETELLLIHGRTAGGHPMRDYEEMKAHDVAIDYTRSLASEEQVIGESDIRQLNKIILKEPFLKYAETPDGQPTQKRIVPDQYKTQPNHVRTATGELHRFAEPEETPPLMEEWTRDFRRDLERSAYPLPLFLAESHWSFYPYPSIRRREWAHRTAACQLRFAAEQPAAYRDQERRPRPLYQRAPERRCRAHVATRRVHAGKCLMVD